MSDSPRYVPRSMSHHGSHSGYDRLFIHMGLHPARHVLGVRLARAIPGGLAWRLWRLRPQQTSAVGLEAELGAMPWLARGRGRLCHFINGEDTYMFTPLWQRGGNRSIATFHYPPQRLALRINPGSVASLHAAVIVGENQRGFLEQILPADRIFHCHHPVDIDFFCPADAGQPTPGPPHRIVCAGSLFRDHATLVQVHLGLHAAGHVVQTDVVGPSEAQASLLNGVPGITVHRGISDETLRSMYRQATVGVLPLTDATANNSLLEMLACGLPVIASEVGGVPDYARGSAVRLTKPGDAPAMAREVCALLENPGQRRQEGLANRAHATARFCYEHLAIRMREIYSECQRF